MCRRVTVLVLCVCVCVSVRSPAPIFFSLVISTLKMRYVGVYRFSRFLTRGFSIKPTIKELWREKANMQMSMYVPRPVLAALKYRACMSRYIKAEH